MSVRQSVRLSVREHDSGRLFEARMMKFGILPFFLICQAKFLNEQNWSKTLYSSHRDFFPENVANGISPTKEVASQ